MRFWVKLVILGGILYPGTGYAAVKPSFDCNKAQTEAEKLVCTDDDLAKLDNELAKRYAKIKRYRKFIFHLHHTPDTEAWKRWQSMRDNFQCQPKTVNKKDCLKSIYQYGIQLIKNRQLGFYLETACKTLSSEETGKFDKHICDFKLADKAIREGADINGLVEIDGCPAYLRGLNISRGWDYEEVFNYLLDKGARVTEYVSNKHCYEGAYIFKAPIEIRKKIIEIKPEAVNYVDPLLHRSLLFSDSAKYLSEMMPFLCEKGINPNIQDTQGYTALIYFLIGSLGVKSTEENLKLVQMFIDCGTDVRLKDNYGKDALANRQGIIKFIKEKPSPMNEEINKLLSY